MPLHSQRILRKVPGGPEIAIGQRRNAVRRRAARSEKPKREKQKNDPKLVAAAREFRDRYLDEVNSGAGRHALEAQGKYDVSRHLTVAAEPTEIIPLLNAA